MRALHAVLPIALLVGFPSPGARATGPRQDDGYAAWLEKLREESPGEYEKVVVLARTDRPAALRFLRERFGAKGEDTGSAKRPEGEAESAMQPARRERFSLIETFFVGDFSIDLCRREDGAFGLGEIRAGALPLRRPESLIAWTVNGKSPAFDGRRDSTVTLRDPPATLTFTPEVRRCAATTLRGFRMRFRCEAGPIVETATWELGGSTRDLSYFDGYRGWSGPLGWQSASRVPETNPKLVPSLLAGTGFQFEHGGDGALVRFHTHASGELRNASRGETLDFVSRYHGPTTVDELVLLTSGESRIDLWTRAYEVVHAELRRAFGIPERSRETFLQWPPFSRKGFRETARECAAVTAREGFTGASIDVIWDNADFHGGAKNMNIWDYAICEGYGGPAALHALVDACKRNGLRVTAWVPAGHLTSASPVWKEHPDWILKNSRGENFVNPAGGIWHGALDSGFRDHFVDRVAGAVRRFGIDGLWVDTHLSYAQQSRPQDHAARLAGVYLELIRAGASHLVVEGDASVFGAHGIAIGEDWEKDWGEVPPPELYYGSSLRCGSILPGFWREHFRRYVAAGAVWVVDWDFLFSPKLTGDDFDAARREVRQVIRDYGEVKDSMVHRHVHEDGSGYTWTNDAERAKVVWLLRDAELPDGRAGEAGKVYVVQPR